MFRPRGVSLSLGREAWQTSGRGSGRTPAELEDLGSPERRLVSAAGKLDANEPSRRRERRDGEARGCAWANDDARERRDWMAQTPPCPQPAHVLRKRWPPASKGTTKQGP
ncbi:hypothetical protein SKAU_G00356550 [Synaphobranchus kaupii]|uniref:Uncharacterized protein n=1 Tax=Synaphobranchus kaupii TaxID=118154 RepID=A0A9Q1EHE1_SYNKA|nr:hypothetical protein SKAU_G00356550 [Synaphobranchus kaupii]